MGVLHAQSRKQGHGSGPLFPTWASFSHFEQPDRRGARKERSVFCLGWVLAGKPRTCGECREGSHVDGLSSNAFFGQARLKCAGSITGLLLQDSAVWEVPGTAQSESPQTLIAERLKHPKGGSCHQIASLEPLCLQQLARHSFHAGGCKVDSWVSRLA